MFDKLVDQYRNKTAVVIGAGGIGCEIARLIAGSVSNLVMADQNEELLKRAAEKFAGAKAWKLDVREGAAVAEFFRFVQSTAGSPHFVFYTAGVLNNEPFMDTAFEAWDRAVDVNLNGAFYCSKAAAELMIPEQRGSILLLSSISGIKGRSGTRVNPVYNATKAGMAALVNAAAMQLRRHGIRINCLSPGPTDTAMMNLQPPAVHKAMREIMIENRLNEATEVAEVAIFVAAHARFTGEDVCVGGGAGLGG